jgi:kynureninase
MNTPLDRAACQALDAADPLAALRDRFTLPDGVIYLDGNSLGPAPRSTAARVARTAEVEWGRDLITSWNKAGWMALPAKIGAKIARLIGAEADEVVVADSTSVNLYKCAASALSLAAPRKVILAEAGDFPTDLYMLQGLADFSGAELRMVAPDQISASLTDEVALLVLTEVNYRSGEIHDMAGLTAKAHAVGALTVWDLSHSAGVLDVDLNGAKADFAVGCGYKYLNGGPGAPAYVFAARRWHEAMRTPLSGWLGHAQPFAFVDDYAPAPGIARMACGTPPVLSLVALDEGLNSFEGVETAALHERTGRLGDLFIALADQRLASFGLEVASPRDWRRRGGQVSLRHPQAYEICQALIARGVIPDFRAPDVARFGLVPMFVRFAEVWDAVGIIAEVMENEAWRDPRFAVRTAVT